MIFVTKKPSDFNHNLNQWLKSPSLKLHMHNSVVVSRVVCMHVAAPKHSGDAGAAPPRTGGMADP